MASFSAIFVRNIMPVSYSTGAMAISEINSSAPTHTLIVGNLGWAFVGKPGSEMKEDVATIAGGAPVAGTAAPGAAADGLPQPLNTTAANSELVHCNPFIA